MNKEKTGKCYRKGQEEKGQLYQLHCHCTGTALLTFWFLSFSSCSSFCTLFWSARRKVSSWALASSFHRWQKAAIGRKKRKTATWETQKKRERHTTLRKKEKVPFKKNENVPLNGQCSCNCQDWDTTPSTWNIFTLVECIEASCTPSSLLKTKVTLQLVLWVEQLTVI